MNVELSYESFASRLEDFLGTKVSEIEIDHYADYEIHPENSIADIRAYSPERQRWYYTSLLKLREGFQNEKLSAIMDTALELERSLGVITGMMKVSHNDDGSVRAVTIVKWLLHQF